MSTIAERVAKGVEYMDTYAPADWRDRIDVGTLDIGDSHKCIFGQVFGPDSVRWSGWTEHIDTFYKNTDGIAPRICHPSDYGFDGNTDEGDELTLEWFRVLTTV